MLNTKTHGTMILPKGLKITKQLPIWCTIVWLGILKWSEQCHSGIIVGLTTWILWEFLWSDTSTYVIFTSVKMLCKTGNIDLEQPSTRSVSVSSFRVSPQWPTAMGGLQIHQPHGGHHCGQVNGACGLVLAHSCKSYCGHCGPCQQVWQCHY